MCDPNQSEHTVGVLLGLNLPECFVLASNAYNRKGNVISIVFDRSLRCMYCYFVVLATNVVMTTKILASVDS